MAGNSIFYGEKYTERTLIESVLCSFYILDYGFIQKINSDNKVDVVHAKRIKMLDGTSLQPTISKDIEVLTFSCSGLSISVDYKKGDKVLLLGLKNYIPKVQDVTSASETKDYQHYSRETMKALPLALFNDDAKIKLKTEDGKLTIECKDNVNIKTDGDCNVEASNVVAKCSSFKVTDSNGNAALEVTP